MSEIKEDVKLRSGKPKDLEVILKEKIESAEVEYLRSERSLFASAFSAGLEIGFSFLMLGIVYTLCSKTASKPALELYLALAYSVGFIFVIIGRAQLFTEHTTLAMFPVLDKIVSVGRMFRLWGIILAGNLLGGYIFAFVISYFVPQIGILTQDVLITLSKKVIDFPIHVIFGSAILAGWLMGLLSWLLASAQETISRILLIILVTATIGFGHLHHSIVGSVEVFSGFLLSPKISFFDYLSFETVSIIGNAIGGVFFVAVVKYSQRDNNG